MSQKKATIIFFWICTLYTSLLLPLLQLNELPPLWLYPMRKFLLLTLFWDTMYLVPDTGQVVRSSTNSQTLGNISSGNNFQSLRSHRRKSALAQLAQWVIFNYFNFINTLTCDAWTVLISHRRRMRCCTGSTWWRRGGARSPLTRALLQSWSPSYRFFTYHWEEKFHFTWTDYWYSDQQK